MKVSTLKDITIKKNIEEEELFSEKQVLPDGIYEIVKYFKTYKAYLIVIGDIRLYFGKDSQILEKREGYQKEKLRKLPSNSLIIDIKED